eukprot:554195_1
MTVHFNLECKDANNYNSSLHPQTMSTEWNNTFHIELPFDNVESKNKKSTNESYTIKISAMIHDAEIFVDEQSDVNNINTTVIADMTSRPQEYTFPDILSNFYGVSNSIISILDSISDIFFVVFILSLTQFQEETKSATTFIAILSISNLISVAVIIAWYMVQKSEAASRRQFILRFCIFFLLSP